MSQYSFLKKYLIGRFLILLALLQLMRVIFFMVNSDMFLNDRTEIISTFFKAVLFDCLTLLLYFVPYTLLMFFVLLYKEIRRWQIRLLNIGFGLIFWFISLLSIGDIFYYKFNLRRINLEAIYLFRDSLKPILNFAIHHPESILMLVVFILLFYFMMRGAGKNIEIKSAKKNQKILLGAMLSGVLMSSLFLYRFSKYLSPLSASLMVAPGYTGLYTNSPQTFLYSFRSGWTYVKPLHYFSDTEADKLVPVFYTPQREKSPTGRNVVLFILESFSYSYLDPENTEKPATPFLDSLIRHSTFFTRAYANNTTSANGLCSILSGLPSLTNQPFFSSPYAANPIDAIGIALKRNNYATHFFLGANDDHFGFKKGTKLLGIDHYHNGEDFPKSLQDGTWGVYDGPFLQYFAEQTKAISQPFFNVFFTISTHYPFKIPDSLTQRFTGKHHYENERAVSYTDDAFRSFFATVQHSDWFHNTVFIFTGDHVSKENKRERKNFNCHSYYHIPIFIFDPQQPVARKIRRLVQHTDLSATIADITGIQQTILSFGKSVFDSLTYRYTVNRYSENIVQLIDTAVLIQYDVLTDRLLDVYQLLPNDEISMVKNQVSKNQVNTLQVPLLKAYMQQYFNRLYYNKLFTANEVESK